jgi:Ca-activated chloride channel homolog
MSLILQLHPAPLTLMPRAEAQIGYCLLTIAADSGAGATPVNWAIVADASRSMRIPIVNEAQFRELVRSGSVQEVLVDGMPVWQLEGAVPDAIRATAPSALDHTARALHSIVERLDQADHFALIACAEEALSLVPTTSGHQRERLVAGISRLASLRLGEATNLAAGMRLALAELGNARRPGAATRLILLSDGFTRDSDTCIALAQTAAEQGVSISTLGLGGEFQADLLTRIADRTGGRAVFVRNAEGIPAAVTAELDAARGVAAQALTLSLTLPQSAQLRHVTRISPSLAPLELPAPEGRTFVFHLGDLERYAPIQLLLEIMAPPTPPRPPATGAVVRLAALGAAAGKTTARADLVAHYTPHAVPPGPAILQAAGRAGAVRMQQRAFNLAAAGDNHGAAALLANVARRYEGMNEHELAAIALQEVQNLAATGQASSAGAKELTYRTRRLGEHETTG